MLVEPDRVRIHVGGPYAFDCRNSLMRNRIRNVENLAARNSEITDRLSEREFRDYGHTLRITNT